MITHTLACSGTTFSHGATKRNDPCAELHAYRQLPGEQSLEERFQTSLGSELEVVAGDPNDTCAAHWPYKKLA
jgi:hypothetical protein